MDYIRFAISNPVKVTVGVLLILLFGGLAIVSIPIQLIPNVDSPVITVETDWRGRSPQEIEREILEEQEDKLKRVSNLRKMTAVARQGSGEIKLEFYIGTNIDRALLEVSDRLREVPDYPEDVDEPRISAADIASDSPIAWMVLTSDDPNFEIESLRDRIEERVKPYLERVEGIARVNVFGGRDREMQVRVNPVRIAQRGITFNEIRDALRRENVNVSAGDLANGRVDVRVRTVGQYEDVEEIRKTIIKYDSGGPVRIEDVADVELSLAKPTRLVRSRGRPAVAINAVRETGSNVIDVMDELKKRIDSLNDPEFGLLKQMGPGLKIEQVYDETVYIYDALDLVQSNVIFGGALAVMILLLFLRSVRPTLVVALAIPVSVIGTFLVMFGAGRNINVISLAGLAFAVGMVVDNAIVVLENIDRHLNLGKKPRQAAYDGTKEVWGAILASTLTTLAVFIPVLTVQEEAGQLFRDIALAICAAVTLSLIVSITVIPTATARFLRAKKEKPSKAAQAVGSLFGLTTVLDGVARGFAGMIHKLAGRNMPAFAARLGVIALFIGAAVLIASFLKPPAAYLPAGNRNLVIGIMFAPPSYSMEQNRKIGLHVEKQAAPFWAFDGQVKEPDNLPDVIHPQTGEKLNVPPIENFFFVVRRGTIFMGAASADKGNVKPLETLLTNAMGTVPGTFGIANQRSIFSRGLGGSNTVGIEVTGENLQDLRASASALYGALVGKYGRRNVRPTPSNFALPGPELRFRIDRVRAADVGVDVASLGLAIQSLVDGAFVGDFRIDGETIDLMLVRDPDMPLKPEDVHAIPVAYRTPNGQQGTVDLQTVARLEWSDAPQEIQRIEEDRAISFAITPSSDIPLEQATNDVLDLIKGMQQSGAILPGVGVNPPADTADKLIQVRKAMIGDWTGESSFLGSFASSRLFLALLITYLLMAALFESFVYPFVIMFSVPLAAAGGFLGLYIVNRIDPSQQLDVLTMLGFVILIGIVVNNAILIVHQALNFMRGEGQGVGSHEAGEKLDAREAIREAVRTRVRPILMTTMTSVFGMLPLVLSRFVNFFGETNSGSELYTGLGSVVIGGLIVSTFFTLIVVPLVFSITLDIQAGLRKVFKRESPDEIVIKPAVE